ncbi:MAG: type II toxin-antitoxin system HicB family antitoxin [Verrucomicrobiota bacterium]
MSETKYEIILYWDKSDEIFVVEVPELAGCLAHGSTRAEAVQSAEEAISLWLETAKEDGAEIPEPRGKLIYA